MKQLSLVRKWHKFLTSARSEKVNFHQSLKRERIEFDTSRQFCKIKKHNRSGLNIELKKHIILVQNDDVKRACQEYFCDFSKSKFEWTDISVLLAESWKILRCFVNVDFFCTHDQNWMILTKSNTNLSRTKI